jgi:hypothetical protein
MCVEKSRPAAQRLARSLPEIIIMRRNHHHRVGGPDPDEPEQIINFLYSRVCAMSQQRLLLQSETKNKNTCWAFAFFETLRMQITEITPKVGGFKLGLSREPEVASSGTL